MRYWIALMIGLSAGTAHAASSHTKEVILQGDVGVAEVAMHPDFVTVLAFPDEVRATLRMDESVYIEHGGRFVRLRPSASAKAESNLVVMTDRVSVNVILRMARAAEHATAQVHFKRASRTRAEPAPEWPISWDIDGLVGLARSGDTATGPKVDTSFVAGASARLALRGSRFHAYEATVTLAQTGAMYFPDIEYDGLSGEMVRNTLLARMLIGGRVSLGERVRPLLRAGIGMQGRALVASQIALMDDRRIAGPADDHVWDVVASAGGGLEMRLGKKWSMGVGVNLTRSVILGSPLFETLEAATYVQWN
jgi:hypothetical protein